MTKVAYFDCFSGASGDMILGALLDAGLPFEALKAEVEKLSLPTGAFSVEAKSVSRAGFAATHFVVQVNEPPRHRSLADVLSVVEHSSLVESDREKVRRIFTTLGEVEARV